MKKIKLLMILPSKRSYRFEFLNELSKKVNLHVLFVDGKEGDEGNIKFKYKIIKPSKKGIAKFWFDGIPLDIMPYVENCDVVICRAVYNAHTPLAFFGAKLNNKPFILWEETWKSPNTNKALIYEHLLRHIVKHSDCCIAAGTNSYHWLKKKGAKKIIIAPNCAEIGTPKRKTNKKFVFLAVGRNIKVKGYHILKEAYTQLVIEKKIKNCSLKFIHDLPHKFIWKEYQNCDVFIQPNIFIPNQNCCAESWSMACLEAMSMKKPVICTTATGCFPDIPAIVINQNDVQKLKEAMYILYQDKKLLKIIGERSLDCIKNKYQPKKMAEQFYTAINCV